MSLGDIRRREYAPTVDAIEKQLPLWIKLSLAFNGRTSMNKLAIWSFRADYMDRNWALRDVQPGFDEVDSQFFYGFET